MNSRGSSGRAGEATTGWGGSTLFGIDAENREADRRRRPATRERLHSLPPCAGHGRSRARLAPHSLTGAPLADYRPGMQRPSRNTPRPSTRDVRSRSGDPLAGRRDNRRRPRPRTHVHPLRP